MVKGYLTKAGTRYEIKKVLADREIIDGKGLYADREFAILGFYDEREAVKPRGLVLVRRGAEYKRFLFGDRELTIRELEEKLSKQARAGMKIVSCPIRNGGLVLPSRPTNLDLLLVTSDITKISN